jgi:hypothetical protein
MTESTDSPDRLIKLSLLILDSDLKNSEDTTE